MEGHLLFDKAVTKWKKKNPTNSERHMHPKSIAALFTIAKTWKQPKCPLTDEWVQEIWYMYITGYYSAIKRMK